MTPCPPRTPRRAGCGTARRAVATDRGTTARPDSRRTARTRRRSPLQEFESGKTTLKDIEAKLGKAALTEGNKRYWKRDGLKYALELTFEHDTLQSLHYTFTGKKPSLDILKGSIDITKFAPYPASGKSAGRFLKLTDKNAELTIDPVSKTIQTVRLP